MKNLISKERLIDTLYDCGFQVLSEHTMKSTIEFEIIMKCINCIESQPVIYSVEKAQEDISWIKLKEQIFDIKNMNLDILQHFTREQGEWIKKYCIQRNIEFYNKAIDDFANLMKEAMEHDWSTTKICDQIIYNNLYDKCNEIAEQLKAGGNNEM